jgi:hypothetical protein
MRSLKVAAVAALMFATSAVPALSAVVINAANTGYQFQIDYTGQVGGQTTPSVSALGTYTFNGVTNNGLTYNFAYSILNDSTTTARLSGFAFNTSPNPTNGTVTGTFNQVNSGNYPEGYGTVDVCFTAGGGSCAGGGSGGVFENNTAAGNFSVTFGNVMSSVSFDQFVTRFQSISGVQAGSSGIGIGALVNGGGGGGDPIVAPEPETWLMLLGGFGLVGWTARRRKSRPILAGLQAA